MVFIPSLATEICVRTNINMQPLPVHPLDPMVYLETRLILSTENGSLAAADASNDFASDYVDSVTGEVLHNNDKPIQNPDMLFLKLLALQQYPGINFVHLRPFQSWLNQLPKGDCLAILTQIWNIKPVATPTSTAVPTVTADHDDATIQTTLAIPSGSIPGQVNPVDLIGMLRARDIDILRGDVILTLHQVDGETILRYMVPDGPNTAQIEQLYSCAVHFSAAGGYAFGFDSQAWLDNVGAFVRMRPEHEQALPDELRWMRDWPDFEKRSWE
ncbi:uncharacterized protein BDV14DRAFT_202216 [Aspergillus stella-maris]|uniref:uncharacterized protein n=1 Tax=Aspergillus stella-maris TaxID=1810926 RepID=UPI003CCCC9A9